MVTMWSCINSTAYSQDCYTADPDTTEYKQIPWYGDESNYTVLDSVFYEMNTEHKAPNKLKKIMRHSLQIIII